MGELYRRAHLYLRVPAPHARVPYPVRGREGDPETHPAMAPLRADGRPHDCRVCVELAQAENYAKEGVVGLMPTPGCETG